MRNTFGLVRTFFVGILVLGAARSASADDWPRFRGPSGEGRSAEINIPSEWNQAQHLNWKTPLPGPGGSSPVVVGNRIYLTCYSGFGEPNQSGDMNRLQRILLGLDRNTGRILWQTPTPAKLPEQESIRDEHGYATSTPLVDDTRIYVFYGKSGAHAFTHSGQHLWETDVGSGLNGWGSAASPVAYNDLIIINASIESESLVALDRSTGQQRWRARGIKESWNTPILVKSNTGRDELVVATFGKILAFNPATGAPLWNCDTDIPWYMVPSLVADGNVVYCIGGRSGGSLAVRTGGTGNVTATHRLWTGKQGSNVSSPILHEGHLYFAHEQLGIAYCLEAKTGKLVYEERLPRGGQFYPSAVYGAGKVYYTSRTGKTFVVPARPEFELLSVNDLDDQSHFHASPAISGGNIYIRSDRNLYSIGSR